LPPGGVRMALVGEQINTSSGTADAADTSTAAPADDGAADATRTSTDAGRDGTAGPTSSSAADAAGDSERRVRHYRAHAQAPRAHIVRARVGERELAALDSAADKVGLTVGSWLAEVAADAAADAPLISGQQYGELRRLNRELRRIGVNLNQVAAKVNRGKEPGSSELERVIAVLADLSRESQALVDEMLVEIRRSGR
ncbi:MAG: plasmid mobilization relaxosome protein MobC, partial [Propionicimonas sp.]